VGHHLATDVWMTLNTAWPIHVPFPRREKQAVSLAARESATGRSRFPARPVGASIVGRMAPLSQGVALGCLRPPRWG
jgi:hypothetical protein